MSNKVLSVYIQEIKYGCEKILDFTNEMNQETYLDDLKTQMACLMNLIIIGEAAQRVEKNFPNVLEEYSHIPWREIIGVRNRIAH